MMESLREIFLKRTEHIIRCSMFDVGRSMFDVHQFLSRFDWPLFKPAAALNLEPLTHAGGFIHAIV